MRILFDTNIFLDVFLEREPFAEDAARLFSLCEEGAVEGMIAVTSVADVFYFVRKYTKDAGKSYDAIGKLFDIVKPAAVSGEDVLAAYQERARDFEDCILAMCAKSMKCDYIITRNVKDFEGCKVPALTPTDFLNHGIWDGLPEK